MTGSDRRQTCAVNGNLPAADQASWQDHWNRVARAAQEAEEA
jgi:hypothetical protein